MVATIAPAFAPPAFAPSAQSAPSAPSAQIERRRRRSTTKRRPRPETLATGHRVGPWKIEHELGKGGMAAVYAVTHTRFGKRAALKLAHRTILSADFTPETFLREARIVHLVDHAGVPDVFATGTFDGRPYLAMERLSGSTLGELVDAHRISHSEGISVLIEVCNVLAAAHAAGVIHRDLKLDNVFVQSNGRVRLLDWGVARVLAEPDPLHGLIAGTLTYVAPEQITGDTLTPAADIYSFGVLAYHTLLGGAPFSAESDLDLIRKHVHARPPAPITRWPDVPGELAAVMMGMLAKDPANRPTLAAVTHALEAARSALEPKPEPVKKPSWFARLRKRLASLLSV